MQVGNVAAVQASLDHRVHVWLAKVTGLQSGADRSHGPQNGLERLSGLVTLAWLACLRVGVWRHETKPIRVLAHGRKAMGLVRYGSEELRHVLRWVSERSGTILRVLIRPFPHQDSRKLKLSSTEA